jgi:hypothetical protein
MTKTTRFNVGYAFLAVMGVFVLHDVWVSYQTGDAARVQRVLSHDPRRA